MATSIIEICNNALGAIGELPITSLTDNSKAARSCNQRWPSVRDAVLRAHEWACCCTDASLPASAVAPLSPEWDYAYPLPVDLLRVVRVSTTEARLIELWEVVGRELLCSDTAPIIVRYVKREVDPQQYDALLSEALTTRLAYELAPSLEIVSANLISQLRESYKDCLREARGVNARDVQPRTVLTSRWSAAKLGS